MMAPAPRLGRRLTMVTLVLATAVAVAVYIGLAAGSAGGGFKAVFLSLTGNGDTHLLHDIIWRLRLPRVLLAALLGATLSLGGMVFQALLRNPLAEPYILGKRAANAYAIVIQAGAILAVLGLYRKRIRQCHCHSNSVSFPTKEMIVVLSG